MNESELKQISFDAEFFEHPGYKYFNNFRFGDLSSEDANDPTGRGTETAAPRGYDNERLASIINDGERVSASWFDVQYDSDYHHLLECKACIAEYPNGQTGRFKLWQHHHEKLLGAKNQYPGTLSKYFFVIYTVVEGTVREIGKIKVSPAVIEGLIDEWHHERHDTMGWADAKQLPWTRLVSALDLDIEALKREEFVVACLDSNSDAPKRLRSQVDSHVLFANPFRGIEDPYPVCGPSCDIQHDDES